MSKASSNKISELKSLRKDENSSNLASQKDDNNPKDDKISELNSMNKEMLVKEDNDNKS